MPNIDIVCIDCKNSFYWKEKDQQYYAAKGFVPPKRCYNCRQSRKLMSPGGEDTAPGKKVDAPTPDQ